jgi:hypothetical protein
MHSNDWAKNVFGLRHQHQYHLSQDEVQEIFFVLHHPAVVVVVEGVVVMCDAGSYSVAVI